MGEALHTVWPVWLAMHRLQQRRPSGLMNFSFPIEARLPAKAMDGGTFGPDHTWYVHRRFGCGFGGEDPAEMYTFAAGRGSSWICKRNYQLCFGRSPDFYAYAFDQFRIAAAALLSAGLRFFLCKSGLLGYVRLCDLEPTDNDLSICMLATDLGIEAMADVPQAQRRLQAALSQKGWFLSRDLGSSVEDCGSDLGGLPIGWTFGRSFEGAQWSTRAVEEFKERFTELHILDLDILLVYNLGGRSFCHWGKSVVRPQDLLPLRRTEFLGTEVFVPRDGGIALLDATYADWTTRHIHAW